MKFAAIKAQMGIWKYYVTTLTYEDISNCVSPIPKEISNSNEELRYFYVAVTRAKEHLYLFVPRNAYRYGRQIYESLAHYLDDGENLYDTCS